MADEPTAVPAVEALAPAADPVDIAAPPSDAPVEAPITTEDEETAGKQATTEVNPPEGTVPAEAAVGPSSEVPEQAQTPASVKATPKRTPGGAGEHKKGKGGKRKSMPVLHLDCQPGEYYWARLKGHPPWPAIVCDEQMLPESLLATRPVSAARPDGSLRDDFKDSGKNAKERTFPIMFLSTNEFAWMINTSLTPLDPKECETLPTGKATKALQDAYRIATEDHNLDYFKNILKVWQEEQAQIEKENRELDEKRAREAEERKKKATEDGEEKKKKKNRKSKGGDDTVMEDADTPKSSKKRKKEAESDADGAKPKKTPKVTKINAPKTPNGDTPAPKKSSAKPKKKVVSAPKEEEEERPQMTEEERLATLEKAVLYLRHRLQKGFLSRDQAPQEGEMAAMAEFFKQLETYEALDPSIIRKTKIHKVLKAIVKLSSIPKDEEFRFKKRSAAMLEIWNKRMEADGAAPPSATEAKPTTLPDLTAEKHPETNGVTEANGEAKDAHETELEAKADVSVEKIDDKIAITDEEKKDVTAIPAAGPPAQAEHEDETMGEASDNKPVTAEPAMEVAV